MSIMVAVTDSPEGQLALAAAVEEAALLNTDLVAVNLTLSNLDTTSVPAGLALTVAERRGRDDRDPVDAVLDEIRDHPDVTRLIIGIKRRTPVGKALLGSVSQRLLLYAPVPVLAVKLPQVPSL